MAFFLISSMVLGLHGQLQIFLQLYLIELLSFYNKSGANWAVVLDISFDSVWQWEAFDSVCHAGRLHKLKSYVISSQIFDLISYFLHNRQLWVVLDGSLLKNIHLMLEFLKALFMILYLLHSWSMTFLMMLSVILQGSI